ncbi:hypothetical protein, partial [Pseudomonas syringae group genomosp. 7]|uniref:hypothetical protein n=1 Tax=Pseudomonas syringae group genomosp. 7 TaxID=251699 RepID=UPI00377055B1
CLVWCWGMGCLCVGGLGCWCWFCWGCCWLCFGLFCCVLLLLLCDSNVKSSPECAGLSIKSAIVCPALS